MWSLKFIWLSITTTKFVADLIDLQKSKVTVDAVLYGWCGCEGQNFCLRVIELTMSFSLPCKPVGETGHNAR